MIKERVGRIGASVWLPIFICFGLGLIASYFSFSFIVGTHTAFFNLSHCFFPLFGWFGGVWGALLLLLSKSIWRVSFAGSICKILLGCHLPSFSAALYLTRYRFVRFFLPTLCIVLFLLHPVGRQAFPYVLFWFIPLIVSLFSLSNYFFLALGSTFSAHAVGTILWLYAGLLTSSAQIYSLIPVVIIERLVFASCMAFSLVIIARGWPRRQRGIQQTSTCTVLSRL